MKATLNLQDAFAYAQQFCSGGNDCPDGQFQDATNTDCTHFMCHVLNAGGLKIPVSAVSCANGLCIRVKELAVFFANATTGFSNIKKLGGPQEARRGDLCFIQTTILGLNLGTKNHVMLLADTPKPDGANVFGHENNRCGEFVPFNVSDCVYYRVEETTWDGNWKSTDADARFSFSIDGRTVSWTEKRPSGATLTRSGQMASLPGDNLFRIERSNDDQVLSFLDFPDQFLRNEILAANPEASFILTKKQGDELVGEWHGLLVKKLPNGHLKELVQPSQVPPKVFKFVKQ